MSVEKMRDNQKTKAELLQEVDTLRKRVAELRQTEEALRESEQKWRSLLNNTPDIVMIVDRDGTIRFIDHTVPGIKEQEAIGKKVYDYISPEHHDAMRKDLERVFQTGQSASQEISGVGPHGSLSWYQAELGPIRQEGRIVVASIVTRDITECKKTEEVLIVAKEQTKKVLEGMLEAVTITDLNGKIRNVNAEFERGSGWKREEVVGKTVVELGIMSPEGAQRIEKEIKPKLMSEGFIRNIETTVIRKDGTRFPALMSWTLMKDATGKPTEVTIVATDITEHKRMEEALRESEKRFREIFENIAVGVYRTTPDGQILMANPALVHMLGYSSFEELSQRNLEEEGFEPQYRRSTFKEEIEREGRIVSSESTWITRDGKKLHVIENVRAVRDEDGKTLYYEGTAENITERKRAGEALKRSEQKFRSLVEVTSDWVWEIDKNGVYTYASPKVKELLGYEQQEVIGKTPFDLMPPGEAERVDGLFKDIIKSRKPFNGLENTNVHKDGRHIVLETSGVPILDEGGNLLGYRGIDRDISERKRAEEALKKSEEKYRLLFEGTGTDNTVIGVNGVYLMMNEKGAEHLGGRPEHFVGKSVYDTFQKDAADEYVKRFRHVAESGETKTYEDLIELPNGNRWFLTNMRPVKDPDGNVTSVQLISQDITERKKAEEKLKQYQFMVESAHDAIFFKDLESRYIIANNKTLESFGLSREQVIGKSDYEIMPDKAEAKRNIEDDKLVFKTGKPRETTKHMTGADGKERWFQAIKVPRFDDKGKIIGLIGIARDITKGKQAEEELNEYREKMARAERLASVGTLSATLTHELNQPLTAIRLSIENSLADLETTSSPGTVIEDLKDGLTGVSDAASIVKRFSNLAGKSSGKIISEVNLKAVAERILNLLKESSRRARVSLQLKGMEELPPIQSNEKDLEQLFFALVENAIQAADGKKSRQLIISGDVKDERIELRFADDCCGIAPKNLNKIFEPFFTTRPIGERTGLGLCIVERIVSGAGGKIRVESKAGKGSTFFVTLPISRDKRS